MPQQPRRDPTEAEIALACAEIQAGWTPDERLRRMRVDLRPSFTLADGSMQTIGGMAYERHLENHEELTSCQW